MAPLTHLTRNQFSLLHIHSCTPYGFTPDPRNEKQNFSHFCFNGHRVSALFKRKTWDVQNGHLLVLTCADDIGEDAKGPYLP